MSNDYPQNTAEAFEDFRDVSNIAVEYDSQLAIVASVTQWLIDYPEIIADPDELIDLVTSEWVATKRWQETGEL